MSETEKNSIDHRQVNPPLVMSEAYSRIEEIDISKISVTKAKQVALEMVMLSVTEFILHGGRAAMIEDKDANYTQAFKFLIAIEKTFSNNWALLVNEFELFGLEIETGLTDASEKTAQNIYAISNIIKSAQDSVE